jgi:hypothetical protein
MKSRIPERNWRLACGRVPHAWSRNHWIISHRLRPQGQQAHDAGWAMAALEAPYVLRSPGTSVGRVGPARRQRAAENDWENEGGATQPAMRAPDYSKRDE